jgi:hypothetical protein
MHNANLLSVVSKYFNMQAWCYLTPITNSRGLHIQQVGVECIIWNGPGIMCSPAATWDLVGQNKNPAIMSSLFDRYAQDKNFELIQPLVQE